MDILCVGMYRACSTWQYEVACHLVEREGSGRRLGFLTGDGYAAHRATAGADEPGRRFVLKSHDRDERLMAALGAGRALGLYAYRDVRDVVYSLIAKLASDFDDVVGRRRFLDVLLANDAAWTGCPGVLVQRYERIVADPPRAVAQIAAHLGLPLAAGEAGAIAAEYSLEANRGRTDALARALSARGIDLTDPANALQYDPHSLLHWNHLRQGRVGGWRDDATPAQRRALADVAGAWLVARSYEPDRAWAEPPEVLLARLATAEARVDQLQAELAAVARPAASAPWSPLRRLAHRVHGLHRGPAGPHGQSAATPGRVPADSSLGRSRPAR